MSSGSSSRIFAVRVDRRRDVAELALVDGADLVVDALLLVGVGDEIDLPRVDAEEVVPARERHVLLDERVDGAKIVRVELEHLDVDGDRRLRACRGRLPRSRRPGRGRPSCRRLVEDLGLALKDPGELGVPLVRPEEPLERLGGVEVLRVDLEDSPVERDGDVDVAEVVLVDARRHRRELARERRVLERPGRASRRSARGPRSAPWRAPRDRARAASSRCAGSSFSARA